MAAITLFGLSPIASAQPTFYVQATGQAQLNQSAPPAFIQGSVPSFRYRALSDAGVLETDNDYYNCCNDQAYVDARFTLTDVVFASPDGSGGSAGVSMNFDFQGSSRTSCGPQAGGTYNLYFRGSVIGNWNPTGGCSTLPSTGVFAGFDGETISGRFTTPTVTVQLDVPTMLEVSSRSRIGAAGASARITTSLRLPFDGSAVFNVPGGVTVNSVQGNITDNVWGGAISLCPCEVDGDYGATGIFDLLAYLDLWFAADAAAERTGDDPTNVDIFDLLAFLDCWFVTSGGSPCP